MVFLAISCVLMGIVFLEASCVMTSPNCLDRLWEVMLKIMSLCTFTLFSHVWTSFFQVTG